MPGESHANDPNEIFRISHTFDAPKNLMFQVWTDPAHLKRWWGPKGFKVKRATVDLRLGGLFHYCLITPDGGGEMWGKFFFREIDPPDRLVFISSFSDEQGGTTVHPKSPDWPRDMLSVVTFVEKGGRTTVEVEWTPYNATEKERKVFRDGLPSMNQGWSGTFSQLKDYLATQPTDA